MYVFSLLAKPLLHVLQFLPIFAYTMDRKTVKPGGSRKGEACGSLRGKEEIDKPGGSRKREACGSLFLLTLIGALTVLETTLVIYQMSFCIADVRMFIV